MSVCNYWIYCGNECSEVRNPAATFFRLFFSSFIRRRMGARYGASSECTFTLEFYITVAAKETSRGLHAAGIYLVFLDGAHMCTSNTSAPIIPRRADANTERFAVVKAMRFAIKHSVNYLLQNYSTLYSRDVFLFMKSNGW